MDGLKFQPRNDQFPQTGGQKLHLKGGLLQ
jgi:hypothetical protein